MQVTAILAASALPFTAWATSRHGKVTQLRFLAIDQADALEQAFRLAPGSVAMSVRQDDSTPPRDALAILNRRVQP